MTGSYEGKAICSGLQNGVPSKQKREFTAANRVLVTQGPTRAVIDFPGLDRTYSFIEDNTQKEGRSIVSGFGCTLDFDFDGVTVFLNAKVKADTVTLKGTLVIIGDAANQSETCKVSLKRVDTANPVIDCAPE